MIDVFDQAGRDHSAVAMHGDGYESYLSYGVKIRKELHNKKVTIYDTSRGEYYNEVSELEYQIFNNEGWLYGIYTLSLSSYRRKLDEIQERISDEANGKRRRKIVLSLMQERDLFTGKYFKVNQLLIKSNQDGNN
jgi:hypothetical protein